MNENMTNDNESNSYDEYHEVTEQELLFIEQQASELEALYKAEMESQTPDLWNRIEANLPPKANPAIYKAHKFQFRFYHIAATAAALLVLILGVPFMLSVSKGHMNTSEAPASEEAAPIEEYAEEAPASEETAYAEDADAERSDDMIMETEALDEAEAPASEDVTDNSAKQQMNAATETAGAADKENAEIEPVSVIAEIVDKEVHCVTIKIVEDSSGQYTIGKEYSVMIDIFNQDIMDQLKIGRQYQVDLRQGTAQKDEQIIYLENPIEQ
ncbi:MAG: hypothetical protein GX567_16170 [Clostridia bacterium]|nr:hypothetical protein [Clostridia bacterium]